MRDYSLLSGTQAIFGYIDRLVQISYQSGVLLVDRPFCRWSGIISYGGWREPPGAIRFVSMEKSHECLDADHMIAAGLSDWHGRDRKVRLG